MAQNFPKVRAPVYRSHIAAYPYDIRTSQAQSYRARYASAYQTLSQLSSSIARRSLCERLTYKISLSDILKRHIYSSLRSACEIVKFFTKSGRVANEAYHMAQILLKARDSAKIAGDAARQRQRRQLLVGFA